MSNGNGEMKSRAVLKAEKRKRKREAKRGWKTWLRNIAIAFLVLVIASFFLFTSGSPTVATPPAPDAGAIELARPIVRSLRDAVAEKAGTTDINLSRDDVAALSTLGNSAQNIARVDASFSDSSLVLRSSKAIPLGRWVNVEAHLGPSRTGFPPFYLKVGAVRFPQWLSRWMLEAGAAIARWRGIPVPEIDHIVDGLSLRDGQLAAKLVVPNRNEILASASGLGFSKVNSVAVARHYCDLTRQNAAQPESDLSAQVRRAFAGGASMDHADARSRLVALAMLVVDEKFSEIAGRARESAEKCRPPASEFTLGGRADLSKHWALSAALAALANSRIADSLGIWKELSDSLPNGSGFSFVDLAADRSGFRYARAVTDSERTGTVATQLATVSEPQLLPSSLLSGEEGDTRAEFESRYDSVKSTQFKNAIAIIDAELDRAGVP